MVLYLNVLIWILTSFIFSNNKINYNCRFFSKLSFALISLIFTCNVAIIFS